MRKLQRVVPLIVVLALAACTDWVRSTGPELGPPGHVAVDRPAEATGTDGAAQSGSRDFLPAPDDRPVR